MTEAVSRLGGTHLDTSGVEATTDRTAPTRPGQASDGRKTDRIRWGIVVTVVLLPTAVTCAALAHRTWDPAGDRAIQVLRILDVGTGRTPLTGSWSRFGWDHPGPIVFWALAPFARLFGHRGVLVGVGMINAAALIVAPVAARRRGGWPLVGVVALGVTTLVAALGTDLLIDPWNPWVAVLPYLAFVMAAWCVLEGEHRWLPVMVIAGTFAVQAHVGYFPLVLLVGIVTVAVGGVHVTRRERHGWQRSVLIAGVAAAMLWIAPVLQQLFGDRGNLGALLDFARHPTQATAGWSTAWGVMGTELGFPGAWINGGDLGIYGVRTSTTWPALLLLAGMIGLGVAAWRRGSSSAGGLAFIAGLLVIASVVTTARVSGPVWTYVIRWWWVAVALVWISIIWSGIELIRRADAVRWLGRIALAAAAVVAIALSWSAVPVGLPDPQLSVTSGRLGAAAAAALDPERSYTIHFADVRNWGGVSNGVFLALVERGFHIAASAEQVPPFERWRTRPPSPGWTDLYIVGEDDLADRFRPPAPFHVVARVDPLTTRQRARADELLGVLLADARATHPGATVAEALDDATIDGSALTASELAELEGSARTRLRLHRLRGGPDAVGLTAQAGVSPRRRCRRCAATRRRASWRRWRHRWGAR